MWHPGLWEVVLGEEVWAVPEDWQSLAEWLQ